MMQNKKIKKAFTLIELLIVIVILALLVAFAAPKMFGKLGKAKHDIARSKMAIVEKSIEEFAIDCGRYPYELEGLDALIEAPDGLEDQWQGRYCKPSDLLDPWGNEYIYIEDGIENVGSYDIMSYGKDNEEGGEGEDADIVNN